ncbi:T9SS type B sorting domain-containing protein, partial [Flavobacterium sp.]|uniref:T9SS type B sorting domain-containing protein n=1 Tax=Flavobacterium sp. TaxID=239 RepID=UPI002612ED21
LNGNVPLPAGTGTFKFQSHEVNNFKITHKNLLNSASNTSTFRLIATCVPSDSDSDGTPNYLDSDDDNDGISDNIEAQGNTPIPASNTDVNLDGIDDAFGSGLTPVDTDTDGIADYLDLDSDNDGILDAVELTVDTDADGISNYRELDSDNDLCNDVTEAGFLDPNTDGYLGNSPVIINANGQVVSGVGYTTPNGNYIIGAPITISTQPTIAPTCEMQNTSITVADNGGNTYQWQVSTDGVLWNNVTNNITYSGATTNALAITSVTNTMNGYKYRVRLDKAGNSCGLISAEATLTVYALPVVNDTNIIQCDDNLDAIIAINLTVNNNLISANFANETFTYYTSAIGAQNATPSLLIPDPLAFVNSASPGAITVWTRVTNNANGCFSVARIDAQVIATQIPTTYSQSFRNCDDYIDAANDDTDGIANFDISSVTTDLINNVLPPGNYSIKYYRNTADRDAQTNAISDITDFRNDIRDSQVIWGRVDNAVSQACWGFARVNLTIDPLPSINLTSQEFFCTNVPSFSLTLDAGINDGASPAIYTYKWFKNDVEIIGETNYTLTVAELANYKVEVKTAFNCTRTRTITLIPSNYATLQQPIVVDLADQNSITVNVTGDGDYVYSLDSEFGPFQDSNSFYNVTAGVHIAYIKDLNGCGTVPQSISILGVPKFFTPNGDGFNDYWNIQGIDSTLNSNAIIFIYDRFGKLLKQIVPTSQGWNGTFNGIALPADDYWFTAEFDNNRSVKGHFALKR